MKPQPDARRFWRTRIRERRPIRRRPEDDEEKRDESETTGMALPPASGMRKEKKNMKENRTVPFCLRLMTALAVLGFVTVLPAMPARAAVKLSKTKLTLYVGEVRNLKVKGAKKVTWSSTDKTVASVSSGGAVEAVSAGSAKIRAKAGKKTLTCRVTVKKPQDGVWETAEDGSRFFRLEDGTLATGARNIEGTTYIFAEDGRLADGQKRRVTKVGEEYYCSGKSGAAYPGWHVVDEKLYYAEKNGRVKTNTTVDGIALTEDGSAKDGTLAGYQKVVSNVVDGLTNEGMSKSQKLRACWKYITGSRFRYSSIYPKRSKKNWFKKTASSMLRNKKGNCYSFACAFAAMAYDIGYEPWVICGRVSGSRDHARDGLTRHSWVWLNRRHYDPEGQFKGWYRGCYGSSGYRIRHTIQNYTRYSDGKVKKKRP